MLAAAGGEIGALVLCLGGFLREQCWPYCYFNEAHNIKRLSQISERIVAARPSLSHVCKGLKESVNPPFTWSVCTMKV